MNWNSNDTKYILKRFIIYILIAFAMFIIGTWKASALTTANYSNNGSTLQLSITANTDYKSTFLYPAGNQGTLFNNYGEGYILFTFQTSSYTTATTSQLSEVNVGTSDNTAFNCDIGTTQGYLDSNKQIIVFTATCPVNLTNRALRSLTFIRGGGSGQLDIAVGSMISFVSKDSNTSSSTIIADLTTIQQYQIDINNNISQFKNATHTDLQNLINALSQNHQDAVDINNNINNVNNNIQDVNDSINNDNITSSDADDFTNNQAFSDSTGLESVIQLPLNMVNSLTSTCQPIQITIPFINYTGEIPCMSTIYRSKFNTLYTIVKLVINGFFVYRLLLKVYELVHNAKQPDEDKLEVIDL